MFKYAVPWISLAAVGLLLCADVSAGPIAYYDFENGSGATTPDTGDAPAYDGTLYGSNVTYVTGQVGSYALDFSGADGEYVGTGAVASTLGIGGNNPKTISAWVYTRAFNNAAPFELGYGGGSGANDFTFRTRTGTDQWRAQFWSTPDFDFDIPGSANNWVHIALVHDGTEGRAYANGVLVASEASTLATNDGQDLRIGSWHGYEFDGIVDAVAVYQEALATNQVYYLSQGGDPFSLPDPAQVLDWDFWDSSTSTGSLEGWEVLNGGAHFRSGDGGGMTPANSSGGYAHDGDHDTFLVQSPIFAMTGETVDGVNALVVQFAGGAGDQDGAGIIFDDPAAVLAFNGGNSNSDGQKGLAFYNINTGEYEATIFEDTNGGTDTRSYTLADLLTAGVQLNHAYRLQYFENDEGGWGWGQVNYIQLAAYTIPEPSSLVMLVGLGAAGLLVYRRRRRRS